MKAILANGFRVACALGAMWFVAGARTERMPAGDLVLCLLVAAFLLAIALGGRAGPR